MNIINISTVEYRPITFFLLIYSNMCIPLLVNVWILLVYNLDCILLSDKREKDVKMTHLINLCKQFFVIIHTSSYIFTYQNELKFIALETCPVLIDHTLLSHSFGILKFVARKYMDRLINLHQQRLTFSYPSFESPTNELPGNHSSCYLVVFFIVIRPFASEIRNWQPNLRIRLSTGRGPNDQGS